MDPVPDHRWRYIKKTVEGHDVQGVIFYNLYACECRALEHPHLKDNLRDQFNIPTLLLEAGLGEYGRESVEGMRGTIEAFIEMIRG